MFFSKKKKLTPQQIERRNKRELNGSQRSLDRELMQLERQEKRALVDIKRLAKEGKKTQAKSKAQELVRVRAQKEKIHQMKGQIGGVQLQSSSARAHSTMSNAMAGATKAMKMTNKQMNIQKTQETMYEFQKQTDMMEMKDEMLDDMFDFDDLDDQAETDAILAQVSDEIGLDISNKLSTATPGTALPSTQQTETTPQASDDPSLNALLSQLNAM
mmetsp:Transcript_13495/g.20350  ORF Transcript_13495/g.20350 Transcript_13495/m.20350 type:complete len:215 (-) Transcript_13495:21-665(-)